MSRAFTLVREQNIPELNSVAKLYLHKRMGARFLSIINDDENKVFSINFRTTPKDSTGAPHILEHSVLNGSEKYPVKEPFVELRKSSLATFINAFTFPDKTCYPVASQNVQDFYNLIEVYVDAVLHPLISEQTLMQEGWHYEINDPSEPLTYKGVVFNEMKGVYSSPDNLVARYARQSLFPKHIYGVDSGGDPSHIPDLTYENFRNFWATYYHPSNSFIYFYGNDDPEKRLKLMEGYLKPYKKKKVKSVVPLAKPFKRPKRVEYAYDAGDSKDIEKKNYLVVNWKLPDTADAVLNFSLRILGHILIGTPASPLRKALLDSGLGEDLAGSGMETQMRHILFSTGLKGTRKRHGKKIEKLIFDTLESLVREGIEPDMIAASMNTVEFRLRENNTGSYPVGIALMQRVLTTWIYDEDPFKLLAFESPLYEIKSKLAGDPRYFEKLIQTHLLDNVHRTTLRIKPDPELGRRLAEEEKVRLAKIRGSLSESQIADLVKNNQKLKHRQETPDSSEALEALPVLKLEDLEKKSKSIPIKILELEDTKVLYHDLFGSRESVTKLLLRGKANVQQSAELLNILKDILLSANFDNKERLKQIVLEEKAGLESALVPSGHGFVNQRLRAQFSESGWAKDQMSGIGYLFALRELAENIDRRWKSVLKKLEAMREAMISRNALLCNVTLDSANWNTFKPQLESFLSALPSKEAKLSSYGVQPAHRKEGLAVPAQVNYVGKGANLYDLGYEYDGSAEVIVNYLRLTYLHDKIRVQGGAYGAFSVFDNASGVFTYLSYRDPNVAATIDNYDNAKGYTSMLRYLTHRTDELRQKTRDEVLSTNGEDFIAFGEVLEKVAQSNAVTVLGSQNSLESAHMDLEITKIL